MTNFDNHQANVGLPTKKNKIKKYFRAHILVFMADIPPFPQNHHPQQKKPSTPSEVLFLT